MNFFNKKSFQDPVNQILIINENVLRTFPLKTNYNIEIILFQALYYNVPHGKKSRYVATVQSFEELAAPIQLTEANLKLCHILGWCTEMVTAL